MPLPQTDFVQTLGAPVLFLFNGLSFLFSGASLPFVKIPKNTRNEELHFFKDMAEGFRYMWHQTGLRIILIIAAMINFFSFIGIVLFMPLCQSTPSLGAGKYGVLMGTFMAGTMAGFLLFSIVSVKPKNKLRLFIAAGTISNLCIVIAINQPIFIVMILFLMHKIYSHVISKTAFNKIVRLVYCKTMTINYQK